LAWDSYSSKTSSRAPRTDPAARSDPSSVLDPISAGQIGRQLFALKQDYTIVFVTHTLRQARRLADYVIFLYLGQLIEHGPTETIFTQPNDPRTKAYIEGAFG